MTEDGSRDSGQRGVGPAPVIGRGGGERGTSGQSTVVDVGEGRPESDSYQRVKDETFGSCARDEGV